MSFALRNQQQAVRRQIPTQGKSPLQSVGHTGSCSSSSTHRQDVEIRASITYPRAASAPGRNAFELELEEISRNLKTARDRRIVEEEFKAITQMGEKSLLLMSVAGIKKRERDRQTRREEDVGFELTEHDKATMKLDAAWMRLHAELHQEEKLQQKRARDRRAQAKARAKKREREREQKQEEEDTEEFQEQEQEPERVSRRRKAPEQEEKQEPEQEVQEVQAEQEGSSTTEERMELELAEPKEPICAICQSVILAAAKATLPCTHDFCLHCILMMSRVQNTCPDCGFRYNEVYFGDNQGMEIPDTDPPADHL